MLWHAIAYSGRSAQEVNVDLTKKFQRWYAALAPKLDEDDCQFKGERLIRLLGDARPWAESLNESFRQSLEQNNETARENATAWSSKAYASMKTLYAEFGNKSADYAKSLAQSRAAFRQKISEEIPMPPIRCFSLYQEKQSFKSAGIADFQGSKFGCMRENPQTM